MMLKVLLAKFQKEMNILLETGERRFLLYSARLLAQLCLAVMWKVEFLNL